MNFKQVGFEFIDAFSSSLGIDMNTLHCKALFGQGMFNSLLTHCPLFGSFS